MPLPHAVTNNLWLKIFSFVLATLIWFVIDANFQGPQVAKVPDNPLRPDATRNLQLPVVVVTAANNKQVFQVNPTEVTVKVRGEATTVQNLDPDDVEVYVRLLNVHNPNGSFLVEIRKPREIVIQEVWPAHVYVKVAPNTNGVDLTEP